MQQTSTDTCYRIKIAGEAGDGIITAGELLMTVAARQGFDSSVVKSFPSNIRGGYTQTLVTIASLPICSPIDDCDILLSMSCDAFLLDTQHLAKQTVILVEASVLSDNRCGKRSRKLEDHAHTVMSVPLIQFARETAGSSTLRSTVALGVIGEILHFQRKYFKKALKERFGTKGSDMVALNHIALESGYLWAGKHLNGAHIFNCTPPPPDRKKHLILEGNQAIALGALSAGCRFFASYPITPATAIGDTLSKKLHRTGGFSYQAEDEIAALGAVIGASFNGCKAMTATSGPGLSLMQEFIGYASMVELPVVIVDVQRVGPSTGMPTKHSQDDLLAAVFGGHGEGQRIVIAPQCVEDCYHATILAFNCAERYQCPTLLLSDSTQGLTKAVVSRDALENPPIVNRTIQYIKYGKRTIKPSPFLRYRLSKECINPMTIPGSAGATYRATGVEHDEDSNPINTPAMRSRQMERRARKLAAIESQIDEPVVWDDETDVATCDIGVCSWGCTALAARHAVATLRKEGIHICALYPRLLFPVCTGALNKWMQRSRQHIVIEANYTGQYNSLVKMSTPLHPESLTFAHGEPITPSEIVDGIRKILATGGGNS